METPQGIVVEHKPQSHRFEIKENGLLAVLEYQLAEGRIIFTHTLVPDVLGGRGLGSLLARAGLDYARACSLKVVSHCWFVDGYIQKHPEYQDLVK